MIFTHTAHSNSKFRGIGIYYISIYLIVMKWLKWCILFKLVYFYSSGQWQRTKNPPANAGDIRDVGLTLGHKDLLEEVLATHSSILAWRIPWTEEPGGLWSTGSQTVGHD